MQEVSICPVCQSTEWQYMFRVIDHSISKEEFGLKRCLHCSMLVTSPRPDNNKLSCYYQSDNYVSHSGLSNSLENLIYLQARKFSLKWKLGIIKKLKPHGSILDVGCGTGQFLKTMQGSLWTVSGVEPNDQARKKAEQLLHLLIFNNIEQLTESYDLITLWHVLEHLPNLNRSLQKINALLKSDGRLLIAVPNHSSGDAHLYQEYWAGFDAPRHLWHFNKKSMVLFLQKHGFLVKKIIPMKLDAYYVSLLSEKYKQAGNRLGGLLKGFMNGLSSNIQAAKTGEYSSLIYIANK